MRLRWVWTVPFITLTAATRAQNLPMPGTPSGGLVAARAEKTVNKSRRSSCPMCTLLGLLCVAANGDDCVPHRPRACVARLVHGAIGDIDHAAGARPLGPAVLGNLQRAFSDDDEF